MKILPPTSESELMERANSLCGLTLQELANLAGVQVPNDLSHDKGWCGQLLELLLGTTAKQLSQPDFLELGIELKTIPINEQGKPLESTYVTVVPLLASANSQWHESVVWHKLRRVLWIPVLSTNSDISQRMICQPILWSPSSKQQAQLRQDWQELTDLVTLGGLEQISARIGKVLQIRPKAAHSKVVGWGIDEDGEKILTLPRGFYLRPSFTQSILLDSLINS